MASANHNGTDRQTDRQTCWQAERDCQTKTDRQTDRQKETGGQTLVFTEFYLNHACCLHPFVSLAMV